MPTPSRRHAAGLRAALRRGPAPYLAAGLVLTVAALVESAAGEQVLGSAAWASAAAIGVAVVVARWSPLGGLALLLASLVLPAAVSGLPPVGGTHLIADMLLVGHAAYRCPLRLGLVGYAAGTLVPATTIVLAGEAAWEYGFFTLILGPAWAVGVLLRRELARSAELARLAEELRAERERQAEVAVAAERSRISRELHDAVAHTVSVMTLQVGVVRRRLAPGSVEADTLRGAETLGRQAVDELRRIVGLVRAGESHALAPLPSLAQLDDLLGQVRSTGTRVDLAVTGDPATVPQAVDMSAYRIVQEALTNALRHAPGAAVDVAVTVGEGAVELVVRNGTPTGRAAPAAAGGSGLAGLRERAHVLGGSLDAGPLPGGGFEVRAVLPWGAVAVSEPVAGGAVEPTRAAGCAEAAGAAP